jgi:Zn-dependent peptidase ImmA (M78 family)
MDMSPAELAFRITKRLDFSLAEFRRQTTVEVAFSYLREKVESSGAFVLLLGNLGSHHTNIPSSVFRGYAIADTVAPFIVINDQDAHVARPFTTLHELTHLWLGATGVSGESTDGQLESYCNNVAGEILLPEREMNELRFLSRASLQEAILAIDKFASSRKISRPMVAYKLLRMGMIPSVRWQELNRHYGDEWAAKQSQAPKEKKEGGPSYYVVKQHRLGHALVDLVRNSLSEGFITATKAGKVLGVKPRNVEPLVYKAATRGGN